MGEYDGFREFAAARGAALSRSAYLLTGDHQLAEDLLQAALTRCVAHWDRIAGGNPEAYVRRAMINERTSWWRKRRYTAEVPIEGDRAEADRCDDALRRVTVLAALSRLPARQRAVIVLRFYEDRTEADTARLLGCSVGTVKSQTSAALARLRTFAPDLLAEPVTPTEVPS
jgi:RNA polymerase sigma-70 factor (sigma-E family)